ncbi:MAG: recO [Pseudonocardiales bacterium]|nr:recO [Jatrophihabitantaceae bacterium]MCW2604095.1 recO [Pseudonocardiales bacterium]
MPLFRDDAVVLRVHKLGEADRIVTLLTRKHGRVRAVGKGVRRTTSRFGARLEPASHIDVQFLTRTSAAPGAAGKLDLVTQTESLDNLGARLSLDYGKWTAASAICEIAERLTAEEGEPALRLYLLVLGALRALDSGEHDVTLVLDAYLIRAAALEGWEPALDDCAKCAAPGPHTAFHIAAGGVVCGNCRPPGSARPAPETLLLMRALLRSDWPAADVSEAFHRREASGLISAHIQWHLERGLRALPMVERG